VEGLAQNILRRLRDQARSAELSLPELRDDTHLEVKFVKTVSEKPYEKWLPGVSPAEVFANETGRQWLFEGCTIRKSCAIFGDLE
jgi:hypothetical protein